MGLEHEIASGQDGGRLHRKMKRLRAFMARHRLLLWVYRCVVIGLGFLCILAGLIMLVTPGPGWLFIFMGMGLWGTEFHWAHRLNVWAKAKVLGVWRQFEERRHRASARRTAARWAGREDGVHHCPDGSHRQDDGAGSQPSSDRGEGSR